MPEQNSEQSDLELARTSRDHQILFRLAGHADATVRLTARNNPRLPAHLKRLHEALERHDDHLLPDVLHLLSTTGPHAQQLVAAHPNVRRDTLKLLADERQTKRLEQRTGLEHSEGSSPDSLRASLPPELDAAPPAAPVARPAASSTAGTTDSTITPLPGALPPTPTADVTHDVEFIAALKVRIKSMPEIDEEDVERLKTAPAAVQRLALRHSRAPWPLLEWLAEHGHEDAAKQAMLRRARDPELHAALLRRLAKHDDWEYREAVAGNPSLAPSLIRDLTRDSDWWVRATIAEHPKLTPDDLAQLADEPYHVVVREHVAAHPHTDARTLRRLAEDAELSVRLAVATNPSASSDALTLLAQERSVRAREAVAAHLLTSPDVLARLEDDDSERVRTIARLRRPNTNETELRAAHDTRRRSMKLALAAHPNTPSDLLGVMAKDRNAHVRAALGLHPRLSSETRALLTGDLHVHVSTIARAANPHADTGGLAALPQHDARVRLALAGNAHAPEALLASLSGDSNPPIREAVARNPATPEAGLIILVPDREVRPYLRQHQRYSEPVRVKLREQELKEARGSDPLVLAELAMSEFDDVRRTVARNKHTTEPLLVKLAQDKMVDVRQALLRRRDLPASAQQVLTRDPEPSLRKALLRHEACLPEMLRALASDPETDVRLALARAERTPAAVLAVLAANPHEEHTVLTEVSMHPNATADVLRHMADHRHLHVRRMIAVHDRVTPDILLRFARDGDEGLMPVLLDSSATPAEALQALLTRFPKFRTRVAQHPNTSARTLERLVDDPWYRAARFVLRRKRFGPQDRFWIARWISARAGRDSALLISVARHPNASPRALEFAQRGNHPAVRDAIRSRARRDARPPEDSA